VAFPPPFDYHSETVICSAEHLSEIERNPIYRADCARDIKRLIMNRASLERFRPFTDYQTGRPILTRAVIDLIDELTAARNATQQQILYGFSTVFLYVHAFAVSNEINGEVIAEHLQAMPFVSPFCMLSLINYVPANLYLYNLFLPKRLLTETGLNDDEYIMIDLASNSRLSPFVAKLRTLLSMYFAGTPPPLTDDVSSMHGDENDFLSFLHFSSAELYAKMKVVMSAARDHLLDSVDICAMSIMLLRCVTFSLQRTLHNCADVRMFTPAFCTFIRLVITILSPTFGHQLAQKFFGSLALRDRPLADLTLRGLIIDVWPIIHHQYTVDTVTQFAIQCTLFPETTNTAHLLITRLLLESPVKLTHSTIEALGSCRDLVILLHYIDAMTEFDLTETCTLTNRVSAFRRKLLEQTPVVELPGHPFLVIDSITDRGSVDAEWASVIGQIQRMSPPTAPLDLVRYIHSRPDVYLDVCVLLFVRFIKKSDFAAAIAGYVRSKLGDTSYSDGGESRFEVRGCGYGLALAKLLLPRLVAFHFDELAIELAIAMEKVLVMDLTPLHWLTRFLPKFRPLLSAGLREVLARILRGLPHSNKLLAIGDDQVFRIAGLLVTKDCVIPPDPEQLGREFISPALHVHAFAVCSLSVSDESDAAIAAALAGPIFDFARVWPQRDHACRLLAKLAASLSSETGYRYFETLLDHQCCQMGLHSGHWFILNVGTSLLKKIAVDANVLVRRDDRRLDYYMQLLAPGFQKLEGASEEAVLMLVGILESVSERTPRKLQETVVDVVSMVYWNLKLESAKERLLRAARGMLPDVGLVLEFAFQPISHG
jgi:hypothetical protein